MKQILILKNDLLYIAWNNSLIRLDFIISHFINILFQFDYKNCVNTAFSFVLKTEDN